MRVLLVEDHPGMRFAVRTLLQLQEDVDVVGEADDAEQALRLIRQLKPELVILDLSLSGEPGGIEACREMKGPTRSPAGARLHRLQLPGGNTLVFPLRGG